MPTKYLKDDATIRALPEPDGTGRTDWWDDRLTGYGVRVSGRTGRRVFVVKYRLGGKQAVTTLGAFPAMGATEARQKAKDALDAVARDVDPSPRHRKRVGKGSTFEDLAEAVVESRDTRGKTDALRRTCLDGYILPALGGRVPSTITSEDVRRLVTSIREDGKVVTSNRVLTTLRLVFNDGLAREAGVLVDPSAAIPLADEPTRDRYLKRDEIEKVWTVLSDEPPVMAALFRFSFLTGGQRIGQCAAARWSEIGNGVWRVPAELFKGDRVHLVPLSTETRELLESVREWSDDSDWVFPSVRTRSKTCDYCERVGLDCGHIVNHSKALSRIRDASGLKHWTAHDFRRTFSRWARLPSDPLTEDYPVGLGVPEDVVDAVLGHASPTGQLGRKRYSDPEAVALYLLTEKAAALTRWGQWVRDIVGSIVPVPQPVDGPQDATEPEDDPEALRAELEALRARLAALEADDAA